HISFRSLLAVNFGGMVIVYLIGISWFYLVSNYVIDAPIALWTAILYCGILQAGPDFLLCMAAAGLGLRCFRAGLWLDLPKQTPTEPAAAKEA
ncbi:biotin transporter BioY, partial [Mitsuokella sp.]|uniref:biotin transporter BioY n=1 Tax=Mitsuokella sp. TaxID=2049034 RepID=UPI003D7EB92D